VDLLRCDRIVDEIRSSGVCSFTSARLHVIVMYDWKSCSLCVSMRLASAIGIFRVHTPLIRSTRSPCSPPCSCTIPPASTLHKHIESTRLYQPLTWIDVPQRSYGRRLIVKWGLGTVGAGCVLGHCMFKVHRQDCTAMSNFYSHIVCVRQDICYKGFRATLQCFQCTTRKPCTGKNRRNIVACRNLAHNAVEGRKGYDRICCFLILSYLRCPPLFPPAFFPRCFCSWFRARLGCWCNHPG